MAALEQIMALPYDSVEDGTDRVGAYALDWTVVPVSGEVKRVRVVTTGPGLSSRGTTDGMPTIGPSVPDTFFYTVLKP